jgi:hypothetical protein
VSGQLQAESRVCRTTLPLYDSAVHTETWAKGTAMGWCVGIPVSLRPDPNSNPDANPHLSWRAAECSHPTRP